MLIPKPRFNLVRKSQQRHDCSAATHEDRFRKIGIQNLAFKDRISFMIALSHNNRHSRLDDSSLFECYFRKGSAKKVTMIQPYVCNDTQDRSDNVRTVQPATQTSLKNDIIHTLTRKPVKSHRCGYLKEGHIQMIEGILPFPDEVPYILLWNQCIVPLLEH